MPCGHGGMWPWWGHRHPWMTCSHPCLLLSWAQLGRHVEGVVVESSHPNSGHFPPGNLTSGADFIPPDLYTLHQPYKMAVDLGSFFFLLSNLLCPRWSHDQLHRVLVKNR